MDVIVADLKTHETSNVFYSCIYPFFFLNEEMLTDYLKLQTASQTCSAVLNMFLTQLVNV